MAQMRLMLATEFDGLNARKNNDIARKSSHFELVLYCIWRQVSSGEIIWLQKNVATIRTKRVEVYH